MILGVLIALVGAPAFAASPFEGRYQGRGEGELALQVFALGDGSDTHFVLAETALMNQCTGDLRGLARPSGPMTLVLRKTEPGAEETCTLTLRFSADRARVRMEEKGEVSFVTGYSQGSARTVMALFTRQTSDLENAYGYALRLTAVTLMPADRPDGQRLYPATGLCFMVKPNPVRAGARAVREDVVVMCSASLTDAAAPVRRIDWKFVF